MDTFPRWFKTAPNCGCRFLVAMTPSPDLLICAKELLLDAKLPGLGRYAAMERPAVRPSATPGRAFCGLPVASGQRRRELTSQMGGGGRISLDVPSGSAKRSRHCHATPGLSSTSSTTPCMRPFGHCSSLDRWFCSSTSQKCGRVVP